MTKRSSEPMQHQYEVLGLPPGATLHEVHQAYRDLALVWHPDRFHEHPRLKDKAHEQFAAISRAHAFLVQELEGNEESPLQRREPAPAAVPPPNPTSAQRSTTPEGGFPRRPFRMDAANVLFVLIAAWSLLQPGTVAFFASFAFIPLLFAAAYNLVPAARARLRWWYVGATVTFLVGTSIARVAPVPVASSDLYRGESFSGGGRRGAISFSEPVFAPPGEGAGTGGEAKIPSGPEPPSPPVPPERPLVPPARP